MMVAILWPLPATAYDDPTVAVCQFVAFGGRDPSKDGFERVEAKIDGLDVLLTFGKSVLNTKPKLTEMSCRFEPGAGGIRLAGPSFPDDVKSCISVLDEAPTRLYDMGTANKLYYWIDDNYAAQSWLFFLGGLLMLYAYCRPFSMERLKAWWDGKPEPREKAPSTTAPAEAPAE